VLLAALLLLGGCARPTGDFGRAADDPIHDELLPTLGKQRARAAGEPVSAFNLSDQEQEMRDRVWRYLVAPHAYDWFGDAAAELQRTRLAPVRARPLPVDRYYRWLHGERFASSRTRYARIADDVDADIGTLPATFRSICAVLEIERQRGVAANGLPGLEDEVARNAAARQAENHMVIDWFGRALANRYESYGYALDHLLVETPHEAAVGTNGRLSSLAIYVEAAGRGDYCDTRFASGAGPDAIVIPSRVLRDAPDEGPYRK
jgi:hypothetical protein